MAAGSARARAAGFTLLELIVVICLVAIFASVALDRLLRYQEIAEKVAMESTIGALRSAQVLQASARILHRGLPAVAELTDENPITWLAAPPPGYLGALYDPAVANVQKGSWYFDLKNKELVYRPQYNRFFTPLPDGNDRIRFQVVVEFSRRSATSVTELSELTIRPVVAVHWSPEF
jgi:prepilin-type N-terminal cleavage/methylation domain-containing protein